MAGRAYESGGYTSINGSQQGVGLWSIRTLRQTTPGSYVYVDSGFSV